MVIAAVSQESAIFISFRIFHEPVVKDRTAVSYHTFHDGVVGALLVFFLVTQKQI